MKHLELLKYISDINEQFKLIPNGINIPQVELTENTKIDHLILWLLQTLDFMAAIHLRNNFEIRWCLVLYDQIQHLVLPNITAPDLPKWKHIAHFNTYFEANEYYSIIKRNGKEIPI